MPRWRRWPCPALVTGGLGLALLLAYRMRGQTVPRSGRVALAVLVSAALPFALIGLLRPSVPAANGMHARYFTNVEWSGYPVMTVVDPRPSAKVFTDRWNGRPPPLFSVRWTGYITVGRAGTYEFATTSDDGTRLTINDRRVVSNEGSHSPVTQSGTIQLPAGSHRFVLDYVQYGGPYALEWTWADQQRNPSSRSRLEAVAATHDDCDSHRGAPARRHRVGLSGGGVCVRPLVVVCRRGAGSARR